VLTDLEMPRLNGFQLTEKIKADRRFAHLAVIALTSLAGDDDITKGAQVGIDDYQLKLDKENVLASVNRFLARVAVP
jgi:two-component system, chemotaxis family, sensor kinase CheA